jgi:hypothetical protein
MKPLMISKQQHEGDDLVILPRKKYEELLRRAIKQEEPELDSDIKQALEEIKKGRLSGPLETVDDLMKSLQA